MNENIVKLNYQDKEIYLVKTAHVSKNSVEDVENCINEVNPDAICIELDKQRYNRILNPDKWRETDLVKVIKNKQVGYLLVSTILSSFQKRMASTMDSNSGGEMMKGIELSKERDIPLVLADRDIKTTFSRIWAKLGLKEKSKLLSSIITSIFDDEEISEEDINQLKEADALEAALLEIGQEFPTVKKVLVDERDQYLSQKIKTAPGNKIVAIIGAAHAKGIERNLDNNIDINELNIVDKQSKGQSLSKWIIPIIILSIIAFTFFTDKSVAKGQLIAWIITHSGLAAVGSILCLSHPLTILVSMLVAPITPFLGPLASAGFFAGIVEVSIRKPKVKDFEDIAIDTATFKGFFKNRVTRTLILVIVVNLFSSIGSFASIIDLIKRLIKAL